MNSNRNITQRIAQTMGHLLGFALILLLGILILLLMPGFIAVSALADQPGITMSTGMLWVWSFAVSLVAFFILFTLTRNADRAFKIYGVLCISTLLTAMILSIGSQHHFGQRWARRFLGDNGHTQTAPFHYNR